ncbi:hypothetical protein LEP1GSC166_1853 [Leptospira kirschneri]|uniref:hypothetical protein n=1 Tax=Leptospira kirschneri TaxID=29507 RepID=UPI0002BF6479|nr:hypothetical protein [Leptospira kirschneri]EMK02916.1 hypothetical protein LEP1GSC166_1853 [Leptospira kirschneri]
MVEIGKVTVFGKTWRKINSHSLKIHYIIYEQKGPQGEPGFHAVGLELSVFGWGSTEEQAKELLFASIDLYLKKLGNEEREIVFELLGDTTAEKYWAIYRQLLYLFGDPESDRLRALQEDNERLKQLSETKVEENIELQEEVAELKIDYHLIKEKYDALKKEKDSVVQ